MKKVFTAFAVLAILTILAADAQAFGRRCGGCNQQAQAAPAGYQVVQQRVGILGLRTRNVLVPTTNVAPAGVYVSNGGCGCQTGSAPCVCPDGGCGCASGVRVVSVGGLCPNGQCATTAGVLDGRPVIVSVGNYFPVQGSSCPGGVCPVQR